MERSSVCAPFHVAWGGLSGKRGAGGPGHRFYWMFIRKELEGTFQNIEIASVWVNQFHCHSS